MQSWFTIEFNGELWRLEGVAVRMTLLDELKRLGQIDSLIREDSDQGGVLMVMLEADQDRQAIFRTIDCGQIPLVALTGKKIWTVGGLRMAFPDHPLWEIEKRYPAIEAHPVRRDNLLALMFEWCAVSSEQRSPRLPEGYISRTADYAGVQRMAKEVFEVKYDIFAVVGNKIEDADELQYVDELKNRFYRPQTIVDLFELKRQSPKSSLVAGFTSCRSQAGEEDPQAETILSLEGIAELKTILDEGSHWEIGSATPLAEVAHSLKDQFPGLNKILKRFESLPIRNRVTLGGQLNTGKGRMELGPILLALEARIQLVSEGGARDVTLDSFFGRQEGTTLRPNEIIKSVSLPKNTPEMFQAKGCELRLCDAYKISRRRSICPAMVTAAFALELDNDGKITQAILAYCGPGSRPFLAVKTAAFLKEKPWNVETLIGAVDHLDEEVTLLGGIEGEGDRQQMVVTLFQKFFHQYPDPKNVKPRQLGVIGEKWGE